MRCVENNWCVIIIKDVRSTRREACLIATLIITNLTRVDLGSNLCLRSDRSAITRQSYSTNIEA
jgi:phage gp37-like protein